MFCFAWEVFGNETIQCLLVDNNLLTYCTGHLIVEKMLCTPAVGYHKKYDT